MEVGPRVSTAKALLRPLASRDTARRRADPALRAHPPPLSHPRTATRTPANCLPGTSHMAVERCSRWRESTAVLAVDPPRRPTVAQLFLYLDAGTTHDSFSQVCAYGRRHTARVAHGLCLLYTSHWLLGAFPALAFCFCRNGSPTGGGPLICSLARPPPRAAAPCFPLLRVFLRH